jgi:endonuclease/exonuclease/phosphatase (EEP) superfamily protein YafD
LKDEDVVNDNAQAQQTQLEKAIAHLQESLKIRGDINKEKDSIIH